MAAKTPSGPSFVVLKETAKDTWTVVGEVRRRPGLPARKARAQAVEDATKGTAGPGEVYGAILRSEWRIAFDL
jgi:hypothetical protein